MPLTSSTVQPHTSFAGNSISFSEIVSAMTFALDMTEGAIPGHALRSCLLGMRIADALGVSPAMRAHLYYALQLKDVGCSSNATRMAQIIGGDDCAIKASFKLDDWRKAGVSLRGLTTLWRMILPGKSLPRRILRFLHIARHSQTNRKEMIQLRCDRGAQIVRKLEMDEIVALGVRHVDEHWDGRGYPNGLKGKDIPLIARICSVAQNLDVFATEDSIVAALEMLRKRCGMWFDPQIVHVVEQLHTAGGFWDLCHDAGEVEQTRQAVLDLDPREGSQLSAQGIDNICEAFAGVVDAKSHFTYRHSIGVADVAVELAVELKLPPQRIELVRRAALLHDVGKLGVPNLILEKAAKLTPQEWALVIEHARMTRSILERIPAFRELAAIASEHHERLDGTGYPYGLHARDMSIESRLLVVADMFAAMAENRPYRAGLEPSKILEILAGEVPAKLDPQCFEALGKVVTRWNWLASVAPATPTTEVGRFSRAYPSRFFIEDELAQLI